MTNPVPTTDPTALPKYSPFWQDFLRNHRRLATLESLEPLQRIQLIKNGVPAELLEVLASDMAVSREPLYQMIGLPRATASRKLRLRKALNPDESERVIGMAQMIGKVERIVRDSGNPKGFDAAKWLARWVDSPNAALGGRRPGEFLDTAEGRSLVSGLIENMQSGAYA